MHNAKTMHHAFWDPTRVLLSGWLRDLPGLLGAWFNSNSLTKKGMGEE